MKRSRRQLILIICTLTFLLGLLVIQINWIVRAARMQEAEFNHTVNMALNSVAQCISSDRNMCLSMSNCFELDTVDHPWLQRLRKREWSKVDTIIKSELAFYDIDLDYEFDIIDISNSDKSDKIDYVLDKSYYTQSLEKALQKSGVQLKVKFPGKTEFVIAQIGVMFIASILLILFITASFIITLNYYVREKKLAARIKEFINNVTHEFKTPLANIAFANNMIKKDKSLKVSAEIEKYTDIINTENNKLNRQVEELLEIAVLESYKNANIDEKFDLNEIIDKAVNGFELTIKEKNGNLQYSQKATLAIVRGDKIHMLNAISNLLDNSCKYSLNSPEIILRTYNESERIILEISDKGIGISKEDQKLIFDKFYRVSTGDIHNVKGFGIGLSYVKLVVDEFNGNLQLKSSKGKGSIFKISLPLAEEV